VGVDGFGLVLAAVHVAEDVGEVGGGDGRAPVPGFFPGGLGVLEPGVEGAVFDDGADVEHADVDPLAGHLGVQGLQVIALGGLSRAGTAHVRQAVHGAGALGGEDGAVAVGEHVRQELPDEGDHGVEDQRHERLGALWGEVRRGDEAVFGRGGVVERVEVADFGADLIGQGGDGVGVGQVGGDDVGGHFCAG
jgi:hypothetical protein